MNRQHPASPPVSGPSARSADRAPARNDRRRSARRVVDTTKPVHSARRAGADRMVGRNGWPTAVSGGPPARRRQCGGSAAAPRSGRPGGASRLSDRDRLGRWAAPIGRAGELSARSTGLAIRVSSADSRLVSGAGRASRAGFPARASGFVGRASSAGLRLVSLAVHVSSARCRLAGGVPWSGEACFRLVSGLRRGGRRGGSRVDRTPPPPPRPRRERVRARRPE